MTLRDKWALILDLTKLYFHIFIPSISGVTYHQGKSKYLTWGEELFYDSAFFGVNTGIIQRKNDNSIDSMSYQFYRCIYLFKCQVLISFSLNTSQGIFPLSSRNKHYLLYKYKIIGLFQCNSSRYSSVKIEIFHPSEDFYFHWLFNR